MIESSVVQSDIWRTCAEIALLVAMLLQFGAFLKTINLVSRTKFSVSWITISVAFLLMGFGRLWNLFLLSEATTIYLRAIVTAGTDLLVSLLLFVASSYIRRIFDLHDRISNLRKENEIRILSAVIRTEEKERKLFAKELHDGLGPILSSIKMILSAVQRDSIGDMNKKIIDKTESSVDNAIRALREISNNLSPHILERYGIEKAIKTFVSNINLSGRCEVCMSSNFKGKRFDYNIEICFYRVVCELINNTLKHTKASKIEVKMYYYDDSVELLYSDNGGGFNAEIDIMATGGMGMSNIESRVKSLNGSLDVENQVGEGIFVKIVLPYDVNRPVELSKNKNIE